jgi:hypothetical protein
MGYFVIVHYQTNPDNWKLIVYQSQKKSNNRAYWKASVVVYLTTKVSCSNMQRDKTILAKAKYSLHYDNSRLYVSCVSDLHWMKA